MHSKQIQYPQSTESIICCHTYDKDYVCFGRREEVTIRQVSVFTIQIKPRLREDKDLNNDKTHWLQKWVSN